MPTLITLVDGTIPVANDFNSNFQALNNAIAVSRSIGGAILSNNAGDATNDIDITAGARWSNDATLSDRQYMAVTALTKQLDATWAVGTNQGMRASGAAIANTTYHIFMIMRPDSGVVDIAADTSATGANIAANTSTAYTKKWRIGSILREAGSIVAFIQDQVYFRRKTIANDVSSTNPGTSAVTRTLSVPLGINVQALLATSLISTTGATESFGYISDLDCTDEVAAATNSNVFGAAALSAGAGTAHTTVRTNTSGQVRSRLSLSDANVTLTIATLGWLDYAAMGSG